MTQPERERGPLDGEFERGYVPADEPPGIEECEYARWLAAGGQILAGAVEASSWDQAARLRAPFPVAEVQWVPVVIRGARALVAPYIDARAVQDRLDEVLGPDGWQDEYEPLPGGAVLCRLRVRLGGGWVMKSDIGAAPDAREDAAQGRRWFGGRREKEEPSGRRLKAAASDALKRAAVKVGIGRYLARCLKVWVDWDPVAKEPRQRPALVVPATGGGKAEGK